MLSLSTLPCPLSPLNTILAVCLITSLAVKPSAIFTVPTKLLSL